MEGNDVGHAVSAIGRPSGSYLKGEEKPSASKRVVGSELGCFRSINALAS